MSCENGGGGNGRKIKGKYNLCGQKGHKATDCWEAEENANKRPKGYRVKGASSSSDNISGETQASTVEMLLSNFVYCQGCNLDDEEIFCELVDGKVTLRAMSFLNNIKLISGKNI